MRRSICKVMTLMYIFVIISHCYAVASEVEIDINDDIVIEAMYSDVNDNLSMFDSAGVKYIWNSIDGISEKQRLSNINSQYGSLNAVIAGSDCIWGIYTNDKMAYAMRLEGTNNDINKEDDVAEIAWTDEIDSECLNVVCGSVNSDKLAMVILDDYGYRHLMLVELENGNTSTVELDERGIIDVYQGPNGSFIVATYCLYDDVVEIILVRSPDKTELITEIITDDYDEFGAICYWEESNTLFYLMGEELYKVDLNMPSVHEVFANIGCVNHWESQSVAINENKVAISNGNKIYVYDDSSTNSEMIQIVISDGGSYDFINMADADMRNKYKNIAIKHVDMRLQGDLIEEMLVKSTNIDVYCYYTGYKDFISMYNHGYLMKISSQDIITRSVDNMYDGIQDIVKLNGNVVCYPIEITSNLLGYNPKAFADLGLSEKDVPKTWEELLSMLSELPQMLEGTDYVGCIARDSNSVKSALLGEMFNQYEIYLRQNEDIEFEFENEIMHNLFQIFDGIDFEGIWGDWQYYDEENAVFNLYVEFGSDYISSSTCNIMPLSFDEEDNSIIKCGMYVMFINPYSNNKEMATKYIESIVNYLPETLRAEIYRDWNDVIRKEGYNEKLKQIEQEIELLEKARDDTQNEEEYEAYDKLINDRRAVYERFDKASWLVSKEGLKLYQEIANRIIIDIDYGLDFNEILRLSDQYIDGKINYKELLRMIDDRMKMQVMETK